MTALASPSPAALAPSDVAIVALAAEADFRADLWKAHTRFCLACAFGARCREADDLADRADSAGLAVMNADPGWRWAP